MSAPESGSLTDQLNTRFDELLSRADDAIEAAAYGRAKSLTFRAQGVADAMDIVSDWNASMKVPGVR